MQPETTILIWGPSHSGSTLLGFLLGSQQHCFALGEWINYCTEVLQYTSAWRKAPWPHLLWRKQQGQYVAQCSLCGTQCHIWQHNPPPKYDLPLVGHYQAIRKYLSKFGITANILIDSSKNHFYLEHMTQYNTDRENFYHVLTHKSVYDFVLGELKRQQGYDGISSTLSATMIDMAKLHATAWGNTVMGNKAALEHLNTPYLRVPYETLASAPIVTIARILTQLNYTVPNIDIEYWNHHHHQIGGNPNAHHNLHKVRRVCAGSLPYSPAQGIAGIQLDQSTSQAPVIIKDICKTVDTARTGMEYLGRDL